MLKISPLLTILALDIQACSNNRSRIFTSPRRKSPIALKIGLNYFSRKAQSIRLSLNQGNRPEHGEDLERILSPDDSNGGVYLIKCGNTDYPAASDAFNYFRFVRLRFPIEAKGMDGLRFNDLDVTIRLSDL